MAKSQAKRVKSLQFNRRVEYRELRKILILCEGEKTEPNYFDGFPINKSIIDIHIVGKGYVADSLVEKAVEMKRQAEKHHKPYIQVWCVFDKDDLSVGQFNRAFQLADSNKIQTAYSNEAFELWYVLHYEYLQAGIGRDKYIKKLDRHLGRKYKKKDLGMYDELISKQTAAILNAERLLSIYPTVNPAKNKPSTTVHILVKELNKYLK